MGKTLFGKVWDAQVVTDIPGRPSVLYFDRHLAQETMFSQAFAGIGTCGVPVNALTEHQNLPVNNMLSAIQGKKLAKYCKTHAITFFGITIGTGKWYRKEIKYRNLVYKA